jgi:glucokinase
MTRYVGVDLGATTVRAVVADGDAVTIGRGRDATPQGPTGRAVTETVLGVVRDACEDAGVDPTDVSAVGVGSIGPLDLAAGAVDDPPNLPASVERVPLTGPLSDLLGTGRVTLHNDAVAGVVGERFHADGNPDHMVYLTVSSGIGAGVCVDGTVLTGWDGNAGEFGHVVVDPSGTMTCGCGRDGHWEAYCSGDNVPRYARRLHAEDPVETALPLEDPGFSAADVFAHAGEDAFADRVIDRVTRWNVAGVANLVHAYAPQAVVVGGAVALENPDLVVGRIRDRVESEIVSNVPEIRLTDLGDDVVVRGAVASAMTDGTGDRARLRQ